MEATFEGGHGPEGAVVPWMDRYKVINSRVGNPLHL
jgi:hypothetical protein